MTDKTPTTCKQCGRELPPKKSKGPAPQFCPGYICRSAYKRAHETPEHAAARKERKRLTDIARNGPPRTCETCGKPLKSGRWHKACRPADADPRPNHHRKTVACDAPRKTVAIRSQGKGVAPVKRKPHTVAHEEARMEQTIAAIESGTIVSGTSWPEWKRRILAKRDSKTLRLRQGEVTE